VLRRRDYSGRADSWIDAFRYLKGSSRKTKLADSRDHEIIAEHDEKVHDGEEVVANPLGFCLDCFEIVGALNTEKNEVIAVSGKM
jgi:hypothetical protein